MVKETDEDTELDGEELESESSSNGHNGKNDASVMLVDFLYNTRRNKLAELTDVPLDQVRPMSMISTYAQEVRLLCNDMIEAQVQYFTNWWKYHHEEYESKGITLEETCREVMQDFKLTPSEQKLLSIDWQFYYYQLRRSIKGEHKTGAIALAQDQIAAQQQQGATSLEDLLGNVKEQ